MRLDGTLDDYPLSDILQLIFMGNRSGTLHIFSHGDEGTVVFGDSLVKFGKTKKDKGLKAVRDILGWTSGKFVFDTDKGVELDEDCKIAVPIQQFILGVTSELDECEDLMARIGGADSRLLLIPTAPRNKTINLSPAEWQVVVHLGDAPTLGELQHRVALAERDLLRIVVDLCDRGLLNFE